MTQANAHPHASTERSIWFTTASLKIFNNWKIPLQARCGMQSETDSEVLAHMMAPNWRKVQNRWMPC